MLHSFVAKEINNLIGHSIIKIMKPSGPTGPI